MLPVKTDAVYNEHTPGVCLLLHLLQERAQQQLGKRGNLWRLLCGPTGAVSVIGGTLNGIPIVPSAKTSVPHTFKIYIYIYFLE